MPTEETKDLTAVVTPGLLRRVAGERSFDRGEAYFAAGAVRSLRRQGGGVKAVVQGTRRYRVRLWAGDGDLGYDCTCPVGRDGGFCKHCVAVGLAWHASEQCDDAGVAEGAETAFGEADLRPYLLGRDKEELVSMLVDQADENERLRRRLTVRAAQATRGTAPLSVWKEALDDALESGGFVHYRDAYDYVAGVEEVIGSLEDLLQAGPADGVIGLAEYGLAAVERSLEYVDDSDGWMGGLIERLQELHLEACRRARPDPVDLAERLFEAETESSFETFHGAVAVYADVLGEAGLAAYRRLAAAEWAKVPALKPGERDPNRYAGRDRITSIMEALARADGDLDALVAVKSRDLSSPYAFLDIAQSYQDAGQADTALQWAERGWEAFPGDRSDDRLREFIADAYHRRKRHDEAMALTWDAFAERPAFGMYRVLERHARKAGQWPAWRDKALSTIRKRVAAEKRKPAERETWWTTPPGDHSILVEIFLHEKDVDGAWREAEAGGCSERLRLALAERRARTHPADSVTIYEAHVAEVLRHTGDRAYEEAVEYLGKIGDLLSRSKQEAGFRTLVAEIRATHKRKRNLMKKLDRKGW